VSATELPGRWLSVALAALTCHALAQAAPGVTEPDIEKARQGQPVVTEQDLQRARQRHQMPSDEQLRRMPVPSTPNIGNLPQPGTASAVDLEALARGFDAQTARPGLQNSLQPSLEPAMYIFVSFSMPDSTLTRLVDQASRARATLVLRGMVDGSLVRTVTRVRQLLGTRKVAVHIDPQAFDRYAVNRTPSFVLVPEGAPSAPCEAGLCVPGDSHAIVAGDVSLDYALAHVQRTAPRFSKAAAVYLRRLRG